MSQLLQFENVSYSYKKGADSHPILNDVTAEFHRGVFYTCVGPSGSGKTTFLSLASALDVPTGGRVLYEGKNIKDIGLTTFRNQYVSIVFQSYNLLPYMTALQNVITAMEITKSKVKDKKAHALEMLEKVGISEEKARQKVLTLSGGQQQRVSIARALSCQSSLILADEPTGNLDESTARGIVELFKELAHKENKCVIVVTHDQELSLVSDTVISLSRGKLHFNHKEKKERFV
ncbi:ABC transporter ATP-binding protein [Rossellomorea aquimaris]|uniref:ABC transporter ATP-binding protein n=1 Tax=Rossellomorea aquimaris TaxID=189382 RepID=UPI001CD25B94|nr:ABC transporter ATP-binding protein [Rossellomorea aquimaris]MCA1056538.1 ABC transporter ATP-binding protein [Rossellomorea aquimaris]